MAKLSPLGPFWLDWRSFGCMGVSPGLTRLHLVQREIASDHLAGGGWLDAKNQVGERGIALWEESGVWYAMKVNQFGEGIHLAITGIEESQITGKYLDHGFEKSLLAVFCLYWFSTLEILSGTCYSKQLFIWSRLADLRMILFATWSQLANDLQISLLVKSYNMGRGWWTYIVIPSCFRSTLVRQ